MKIIGKTKDGFILEASEHETANLVGFYYRGAKGCPELKVGDDLNIADMYKHLYEMAEVNKELTDAASKLRTAADLIGTLPEPITSRPH